MNTAARTPKHKEAFYQSHIIRYLRSRYPSAFIWKAAAGPYSQGGIPDVCAIINGRFYGFEVKRPGGKPSKLQQQAISKIKAAGGYAAVVITPADAQAVIDRADAQQRRIMEELGVNVDGTE